MSQITSLASANTIQAAVNAANDGDTIIVDAGTYVEDLTINKAVTIEGANYGIAGTAGPGVRGAETIIQGTTTITASGAVTIDGVEVFNTSDNGTQFVGVRVSTSAEVTITNSVFFSPVANGSNDDRAILLDTTATGHVVIADNLITGDASGKYSTSSWHRGIWSDGATAQLDVTGNTFQNVRSGMNLDGYDDAHVNISGNTFANDGTGLAIGTPVSSAITGIHDNTFKDVDTDFNLKNIASAQTLDLNATHNSATVFGGDATGVMNVLGTQGGDTLTGSAGADFLDRRRRRTAVNTLHGLGGNDTLIGSHGNDTLDGGIGNDLLDGDTGNDTATYAQTVTTAEVAFDTDHWVVTTGGPEGTDTLVNVERIDHAGGHMLLVGGGGYATIQAAINAASDGDTIVVAAGTYVENLAIDKAVTIVGANHGIAGTGARGAETIIQGTATVTASGPVVIDGVEVLNTSNNTAQFIGVRVSTSADVTIENSLFYSSGANGSQEDRAINLDTTATGHVVIADNLITGASTGKYSTASWHRGIWSDGATAQLDVTGNTFHNVRTGMNLDGYNDTHVDISGNTFANAGTGFSIGTPVTSVITGIHDNTFQGVDVDFNLKNITSAHTFDLDATHNSAADATDVMYVLGTQGGDVLTGSAGADILDAADRPDGISDTAANTLHGLGGNDTLIGSHGNDILDGGAGADQLIGGVGTDTATYATSSAGVSINLVTGVGHGGDAEGDSLSGIENVIGSSHDDTFVGDASANVFTGGNGNDVYTVSGSDTVVELNGSAGGIDEVRSAQTITLADNVENLTLIDGASDLQTFEDMNLGAITDGENGWQVNGPNAPRDQEIVDVAGNHMFRMSSDPAVADFAGPYSPALSFAAGEPDTGAHYDSQSIDFDFKAVNPAGDGSRLEVDFGIASGQDRNNFLVLESFNGGIRIAVSEPDTSGNFSGNGTPARHRTTGANW